MSHIGQGLTDKLYWRKSGGRYHCFKKLRRPDGRARYVSLCGHHSLLYSGGQAIERPPVHVRCGFCDGAECKRRGWDESGPETEVKP